MSWGQDQLHTIKWNIKVRKENSKDKINYCNINV